MIHSLQTIVFDLDGTLYDEERIYDRFSEELASRLPAGVRDDLIRDWSQIKTGAGPALIGLGFDEERGRLFGHSGGRITHFVDWDGRRIDLEPEETSTESPLAFAHGGLINLGDWWGLLSVLAARHGLGEDARREAFLATRTHMSSEAGRLGRDPALRDSLRRLQGAGSRLIAMSNSPTESVMDTFEQLGIAGCFDAIVADASKPAGLIAFLRDDADPGTTLSIGDNYVNDIEPALDAGARALYIDRHHTGLGADRPGCVLVPSIDEAWGWLHAQT